MGLHAQLCENSRCYEILCHRKCPQPLSAKEAKPRNFALSHTLTPHPPLVLSIKGLRYIGYKAPRTSITLYCQSALGCRSVRLSLIFSCHSVTVGSAPVRVSDLSGQLHMSIWQPRGVKWEEI